MSASAVLVLNSTYQLMNTASWQRAVELVYSGKAEALHNDERELHSTSGYSIKVPLVIRMLYYVRRKPRKVQLTKKNLILRDDHTCGYCGRHSGKMTVDHIVPQAFGGRSTWENLITACEPCNGRKRNRTPEQAKMPLLKRPREPQYFPFVIIKKTSRPMPWWQFVKLYEVGIEEQVGTLPAAYFETGGDVIAGVSAQ